MWAKFRVNAWIFGILLFVISLVAMKLGYPEAVSSAVTGIAMTLPKLVERD